MDRDDQLVARKQLMVVDGKLSTLWQHVETRLAGRTYLVTTKLTLADIVCFATAATLSSGWLVGIDKAFLREYPNVTQHKSMMASIPEVRRFYESLPESVSDSWHADKIDISAFQPPQ
jgi:glutathione S-transferase